MAKTLIIHLGDEADQVEGIRDYSTLDILVLMPEDYHGDVFDIKKYKSVTIMIYGNYSTEKLKVLLTHCFENKIKHVNLNNQVTFRADEVEAIPVIGINSEWFWNNNDLEKQALDKCLGYTNNLYKMINDNDFKDKHEMVKKIIDHRDKYFKGDSNE